MDTTVLLLTYHTTISYQSLNGSLKTWALGVLGRVGLFHNPPGGDSKILFNFIPQIPIKVSTCYAVGISGKSPHQDIVLYIILNILNL